MRTVRRPRRWYHPCSGEHAAILRDMLMRTRTSTFRALCADDEASADQLTEGAWKAETAPAETLTPRDTGETVFVGYDTVEIDSTFHAAPPPEHPREW